MDTLSQLSPGQFARVKRILGSRDSSRQLVRMGITPGSKLELLRKAPLGDPLHFRVGNFELCLRRDTATQVEVEIERVTPA